MARTCSICTHPAIVEIDACRDSLRRTAAKFTISDDSLHRHREHRRAEALAEAARAGVVLGAQLPASAVAPPTTWPPTSPAPAWPPATARAQPPETPGVQQQFEASNQARPGPPSPTGDQVALITPEMAPNRAREAVERVSQAVINPPVNHPEPPAVQHQQPLMTPEEEEVHDEARALKNNRAIAGAMLGVGGRYIQILHKVASKIEKQLEAGDTIDLREVAAIASAAARLSRAGMENLRDGHEMSRRKRGEPDVTVKHIKGKLADQADSAKKLARGIEMLRIRTRHQQRPGEVTVDAVAEAPTVSEPAPAPETPKP